MADTDSAKELWYHAAYDDSESWHGACATREEAIAEGKAEHDSSFYICSASSPPLRLADWINADQVLEQAEEQLFESDRVASECDDGPWFEVTPDQRRDLVERLQRACDEWQAAHGLVFTCRTFEHMSPPERIDLDQGAAA